MEKEPTLSRNLISVGLQLELLRIYVGLWLRAIRLGARYPVRRPILSLPRCITLGELTISWCPGPFSHQAVMKIWLDTFACVSSGVPQLHWLLRPWPPMEMSLHAMAAASVDTQLPQPLLGLSSSPHSGGSYSSYRVWPDRPPHLDWNEDPSCWMGRVASRGYWKGLGTVWKGRN